VFASLHVRRAGVYPFLRPASLQARQQHQSASNLCCPNESAAPRTRSTWLQLLYSLAADILHVHGATSTPPEAWYDTVAKPRIHQSTFVSARDSHNAALLSRHLEWYSRSFSPTYAGLYGTRHSYYTLVLLGCHIEPLASRSHRMRPPHIHTSRCVF
jgi:hypothetical protein